MGKVISFSDGEQDEPKEDIEQTTDKDQATELPPFLKDLKEYILSYYPNTIGDILGFSGFLKNDSPYVFVGYVAWEDKKGAQAVTPLIAMFRNQDKRFVFLNAKNHYFDSNVLKADIQNLGINIEEIFRQLS